jgi:beta-1,4-mannosyl-glycoprotein beta-1,4-N-acetylglucosaminyltransferase
LIKIKEEGLKEPISCLEQDMYYYNLNNKLEEKWYRSKIVRYDKIKEYFDKSPNIFQTIVQPEYNPDGKHIGKYPIIKNGGWHLSFFGGVGMIKNKIKNFSHTELSHFGDESYDKINEKIQNNKDIFDREDIEFEFIHIEDNDYLPENYKMLL